MPIKFNGIAVESISIDCTEPQGKSSLLFYNSPMPDHSSKQQKPKTRANPKLKSSIVHQPFATGTINIFNPHRNKSRNHTSGSSNSAKEVLLNGELETVKEPSDPDFDLAVWDTAEIVRRESDWWDSLFSLWGISGIALLLLVNLISAGFIWRTIGQEPHGDKTPTTVTTVGNNNLTNLDSQEFMPLNLSTLGSIPTVEEQLEQSSPKLSPISPALAPIKDLASLSVFNTQYHYVLTEYTGEQSLIRAKQKTSQVSLVNFPQGVFIYLGAFKERQEAEQFVTQLKQENFSAYVYPLD